MATDLDEFYPFATGAGANVSEEEWREMAEDWLPTGVVAGEDSELAVVQHSPSAAASIDVSTGEVRIAGHVGLVTATKTLGIAANASGNPRIDLIVARAVFTAGSKKIELDVLQGTAAAAPVEPALTQNLTSMWEEPLAAIDVAAGFATIVTANIRDRRFLTRTVRQLAAKEPVRVATTTALAASTVTGTTRVANANGALPAIDGVTLVAADRLLDKDHATTAQRGLWRVVDPGSATRPWTLERPRDFDMSADVRDGLTVVVNEGTVGAGRRFQLTTNDPIVLGTTGLTFDRISAGRLLASATISVSQTAIGATPTDLTNGSFTVVVPPEGVYLESVIKTQKQGGAGFVSAKWRDVTAGTTLSGGFDIPASGALSDYVPVTPGGYYNPGAGTRTLKLQAEAGSNTMDVLGFTVSITEAVL